MEFLLFFEPQGSAGRTRRRAGAAPTRSWAAPAWAAAAAGALPRGRKSEHVGPGLCFSSSYFFLLSDYQTKVFSLGGLPNLSRRLILNEGHFSLAVTYGLALLGWEPTAG